ncbi:Protein of unknown function [Gryllus bimaculatus]|nr:Protein of unknown function [Gryllus bimaculatus]
MAAAAVVLGQWPRAGVRTGPATPPGEEGSPGGAERAGRSEARRGEARRGEASARRSGAFVYSPPPAAVQMRNERNGQRHVWRTLYSARRDWDAERHTSVEYTDKRHHSSSYIFAGLRKGPYNTPSTPVRLRHTLAFITSSLRSHYCLFVRANQDVRRSRAAGVPGTRGRPPG